VIAKFILEREIKSSKKAGRSIVELPTTVADGLLKDIYAMERQMESMLDELSVVSEIVD